MKNTIEMQYNSSEKRKRLGAFFTPDYAVEKSTTYLRNIINSLNGEDYVIVDRCCGTGNLEKFLTDEELSHCILNTINYAEWLTMKGLYEGRARAILPADESSLEVNDGLLKDGDALEESFYNTLFPMIKGKTVIMLENPPYAEPQAEATRSGKTLHGTSNNYITGLMKQKNIGRSVNDMANKFIWSAFNVIKADYYIVYSPVKYFKSQNLANKKFIEGTIVNRKDFHATEGGISLMVWKNEDEVVDSWQLENCLIKKVKNGISKLLPKSSDGKSVLKLKQYDFITTAPSGTPDFKHGGLCNSETVLKAIAGNSVSIAAKLDINYAKQALPLFAANCYVCKDFTEKEVIMKSSDGGLNYLQDNDFVNDCLIYVGLTNKNKCISNKTIKNECCIGQATKLDSVIDASAYQGKAKALKLAWDMVLTAAKACSEFNPAYNYGLYQIEKELNIKQKYPALNTAIGALKKELKTFYTTYIVPKLFSYELLK